MGYDLHITRKHLWFDEEGPEILLAEWLAFVAADPEMRLNEYPETRLPDGRVVRAAEVCSVWIAYSQHDESDNKVWFCHRCGEIFVKSPDEEIIRKMLSIAQALSAKVQGDDCEIYDSSASVTYPEGFWPKKPWWKFW
jgi:hypothetical protein